jgi:hypothetical protein
VVQVGFVVDKVAMGHVFLQVLRVFPAIVIPSVLHENVNTEKTNNNNNNNNNNLHLHHRVAQ